MIKHIKYFIWVVLLAVVSCSQTKKKYGPDDYLYRVIDTSGEYQQFGYKDKDGEIAIPFGKYKWAYLDTIKTIGFVLSDEGEWAIDKNGEKLFKVYPSPNNGPDEVNEGVFRILDENDLVGYANMNGQVVIPPRFTHASPFREGLASFCEGCKTGKYKQSMEVYIREFRKNGDSLTVYTYAKYGFINANGDTIIAPIYDHVGSFKEGVVRVLKDRRSYCIDKTGKEMPNAPCKNSQTIDLYDRVRYVDI